MDVALTADQCAAAAQIIPLVLIAHIAERRLFYPENLFLAARVFNAIALFALIPVEAIALVGIDGGIDNVYLAALVFVATVTALGHVVATILAEALVPLGRYSEEKRRRK